jgi:hypothetical protein
MASKCQLITDFFHKSDKTIAENIEIADTNDNGVCRLLSQNALIDRALENITKHTHIGQRQSFQRLLGLSKYDYIRCIAIHYYLLLIRDRPFSKMESSLSVVASLFPSSKGRNNHTARKLRDWAVFYIHHLKLPITQQGSHVKTKSLINEEDVQNQCLVWLRSQRPDSLSGRTFSN